jgi:hypothetical protein
MKTEKSYNVGSLPAPKSAYRAPRCVSVFLHDRARSHKIEIIKARAAALGGNGCAGIMVNTDRWARRCQMFDLAEMRQGWVLCGHPAPFCE